MICQKLMLTQFQCSKPITSVYRKTLGEVINLICVNILRIKNAGIFLGNSAVKRIRKLDRKSIAGLILLLSPYAVGVLTRQSASISDQIPRRFPACDSFIHELCIPTMYVPIPLGVGYLVLNLTSFLLSASLFITGFFLVKKKSK